LNLRGSWLILLRALSPIFVSLLLFLIDFWGFAALFFERNPPAWEVVPAWFILTMVRAYVGLMTASLVLNIPRRTALTKRNLTFCYFIIGPPLYVTSMTILKMMNLATFSDQISYLLPTYFLSFFQEPVNRWFTAQGFSYEAYLRVYFSLVEPFIAEFPRLLLSILSIRTLRIKTTTIASSHRLRA
jgi:hypothetical protein